MGRLSRIPSGLCLAACLLFVGILQSEAWEVEVKDDLNKTCLYASMLMNFTITYETNNGSLSNATFVAPSAVKSNRSTCGNDTRLVIDFDFGHSWSLNFTKNNATYEGSVIVFTINTNDTALFPDGKAKGTVNVESSAAPQLLTPVQLKTKYRCSHPTTVYAKDVVQIYSDITLQAYVDNGIIGKNETVCAADQPTSAPTPAHTTIAPTTVVPKPAPSKPSTGTYFVKQENVTCVLATMGLQLNLTQSNWIANINPNTTEASGSCSNQTATMILRDNTTGTIAFRFILANGRFHLKEVNLTLLNKSSDPFTNSNLSYWDTTEGSSYMCLKEQTIEVVPRVFINTFDVKIQPFKVKNGSFSTAEHCPAEQETFIVPIVVGVVLGVLVIAVLVAYFVGHKKHTVPRYEQF